MIRLSTEKDINGIITVWHEAFGDSEEDIRFFLGRKYIPENTVIYDDNGSVESVLFLLQGNLNINGKDYPSYYLYAACTSIKCRGKGIMAKMLEYSKNLANGRGIEFICLRPGEKSLFDYYKKHGYQTVFFSKKLTVNRESITKRTSCVSEPFDYFKWDDDAVKFAVDHNRYFGGNDFTECKSHLLYTVHNDCVYVKEYAFTSNKIPYYSTILMSRYSLDKVIFNLPSVFPTNIGEYIIEPDGMAISCGNTDIKLINNGYLGLTLE